MDRCVFVLALLLVCQVAAGATLEKLSVEQMTEKATVIARGRVTQCAGEARGSVIFTRCLLTVSETWKGISTPNLDFAVPGGSARGLTQTYTGVPKVAPGAEYVLFLWAGKTGVRQVIGLSQGVFDVKVSQDGLATAERKATGERMLNTAGLPIPDHDLNLSVQTLKSRVIAALTAGGRP